MVEEVDFVLKNELSGCDRGMRYCEAKCVRFLTIIATPDFRAVVAYPSMLSMVNRTVSRALVGYPLCRNEDWLHVSLGYTVSAFTISAALRNRPRALRPLIYMFLTARRTLNAHLAVANSVIAPVLEARKSGDDNLDILQWLLDGAKGQDQDPRRIANKVLFIALAAMNASNMGIVHVLFDLCTMPQYIEPLREDIQRALDKAQGWNLSAIQSMHMLDSFLKESQRINHPGLCKFDDDLPANGVPQALTCSSLFQS